MYFNKFYIYIFVVVITIDVLVTIPYYSILNCDSAVLFNSDTIRLNIKQWQCIVTAYYHTPAYKLQSYRWTAYSTSSYSKSRSNSF